MSPHRERPATVEVDHGPRAPAPRHRLRRPSLFITGWLTLVWVLLWGEFSLGQLVFGVLVALLVTTLLPLPSSPMKWTVRPTALVRLVLEFARDLIVASFQVTVLAVTGRRPLSSVIRVQLHGHSDVYLATTAGLVSLVPGTVVVDAHRLTGTLYLHVLDARDAEALQRAHDSALRQEELVLRAFATRAELVDAGYVPSASMKAGRLDARTGEVLGRPSSGRTPDDGTGERRARGDEAGEYKP